MSFDKYKKRSFSNHYNQPDLLKKTSEEKMVYIISKQALILNPQLSNDLNVTLWQNVIGKLSFCGLQKGARLN